MRIILRSMVVLGAMGLAACSGTQAKSGGATAADPDARSFTGTIISFKPTISLMKVSKVEHVGDDTFPNEVLVKYDANTKFLIDGKAATLDEIRQYMTVHISGHMRGGQMFAERADFSSRLPKNVIATPEK